jgi:hypothetical protein
VIGTLNSTIHTVLCTYHLNLHRATVHSLVVGYSGAVYQQVQSIADGQRLLAEQQELMDNAAAIDQLHTADLASHRR